VWIGTALVPYVPVTGLRYALGIILAAASLGVASKAGADLSPGILAGVPLALAIFTWIIHRRHPMPLKDHPAEARA
jgi:hypothetical protein